MLQLYLRNIDQLVERLLSIFLLLLHLISLFLLILGVPQADQTISQFVLDPRLEITFNAKKGPEAFNVGAFLHHASDLGRDKPH